MNTTIMSVLAGVLCIYVGLCALLYVVQRSLLYFPTPEVGHHLAPKVTVPSDGELLQVWRLGRDEAHAVIYFGGNAEDVALNIPQFSRVLTGHSIYLVNYRGYGGSTGSPTEAGLYRDALNIYDYVRDRHSNISVIGRSLGGGVATYLAAARPVAKLVLVAPFDSIVNVARKTFAVFPVSLLLKDRFDSVARVGDIRCPTLVILAEFDEVIPRQHSEALIAIFPDSQVTVTVISGATHNTIDADDAYVTEIGAFL